MDAAVGPLTPIDDGAGPAFAEHEATQQPSLLVRIETPGREVGIGRAGSPGGLEGGLVDDGRAGNGDPFLLGPSDLARLGSGAAVGDHLPGIDLQAADVGLPTKQTPEGTCAPVSASWCGNTFFVEREGDLTKRQTTGGVVSEDPPHDGGLLLVDDEMGKAVALAGHTQVAKGGTPGNGLAGPGPKQLASAASFGDLGPFVLGDDRLDLDEQTRLGVRVDGGGVQVEDGDAMSGELVADEHLVCIRAAQPVRGEAPHLVEQASFGGISQRVETGAVEACAGDPVIDVLAHQLDTVGRYLLVERFELRADGASGLLGIGGHAGIDADFHHLLGAHGRSPTISRASQSTSADNTRV